MKRLFLTLPDPLPELAANLAWQLQGGETGVACGIAATANDLPKADAIWLALPAGRVLLTRLALSQRALRQLRGALANALEDRLMLDPSQVHVALGKTRSEAACPVAVIESDWLEQGLAWCRKFGIDPDGAIPETLLWRSDGGSEQRRVEPLQEADSAWSARWRNQTGFVRTGACAGFTLDDGDAGTPPLALQLALAEARRAGTVPACIVLDTDIAVDADGWSRKLNCPLQLQTLQADPLPPALNLLQGRFAARRQNGWAGIAGSAHFGKLRLAAGLLAAALGLHVLATLIDWGRLAQENRQLRAEMRQVFQTAFPQTRAIVDPSLQMQRQLSDLRRSHGYAETGDFLHALAAVSGHVAGVAGVRYENGVLTLLQPHAADPDSIRNSLQDQGYRVLVGSDANGATVSLERSPL